MSWQKELAILPAAFGPGGPAPLAVMSSGRPCGGGRSRQPGGGDNQEEPSGAATSRVVRRRQTCLSPSRIRQATAWSGCASRQLQRTMCVWMVHRVSTKAPWRAHFADSPCRQDADSENRSFNFTRATVWTFTSSKGYTCRQPGEN